MLKELDTYDWREAFGYAGTPTEGGCGSAQPEAILPNYEISLSPVSVEDVKAITWFVEGEHDESEWLLVAELRDGRWLSLRAGCDYTGWD